MTRSTRSPGGNGGSKADTAKLAALEKNTGTQKLKGKAVTVTLNDAPPNATAKLPGYPEPQPDDLVIHQQDLQALANALWLGGAQGIKVMDQRLISTSAVRCVGNTLILQGRAAAPCTRSPRSVTPRSSSNAFAHSPAIQNYMVYVNVYGLGWKVEENGTVTLPGYGHSGSPLRKTCGVVAEAAAAGGPVSVRVLVRTVSELCITIGTLIVLFVVYVLFWTGVKADSEMNHQIDQLQKQWSKGSVAQQSKAPTTTPATGDPKTPTARTTESPKAPGPYAYGKALRQ